MFKILNLAVETNLDHLRVFSGSRIIATQYLQLKRAPSYITLEAGYVAIKTYSDFINKEFLFQS